MFSQKLLHFFPPPKFLNIPYAGLSTSDRHIRAIQFESNSTSGLKIKKYIELPLPDGAIVAGRVNNKEEIIHVLENLKKQTGIEYVRVSLPEEKAYLFELEVPIVQPKDLRSAIEFKIEENVPLPADQVTFDYVIVEKNDTRIKTVVSALPVLFVSIYVDLLQSAGLNVCALEIESQAIARALIVPDDPHTYLILHFNKNKVALYIVSKRVVHFTSTVIASEGWQNNSSVVVSEIKKVLTYWQTHRPEGEEENSSISKIFICGDSFEDTIASHLSSLLQVDVVFSNVWINAFDINTFLPEMSFTDSLKYASAIGLALPGDTLI